LSESFPRAVLPKRAFRRLFPVKPPDKSRRLKTEQTRVVHCAGQASRGDDNDGVDPPIAVMCLFVSGVGTAALYFVKNSLQNLILSCLFEAFSSLGISVLLCIMVDLFPTNMRYTRVHMYPTRNGRNSVYMTSLRYPARYS